MAYYPPYGYWPPVYNPPPAPPRPETKGHALRRDANFAGAVTITQTLLLQLFFSLVIVALVMTKIADATDTQYYGLGNTRFLLLYAFSYAVGMGLPGPLVALITGRRVNPFARYDDPADGGDLGISHILLAPLTGLAFCVVANFVTNWIVYLFSLLGIYPPDMPGYMEKTALSLGLNILIFAVLPAIFEEMLYRGYILRILRSYGDGVALWVSTALFALMHGNILQIPFAFMVGAVCGYLALRTRSIFPSILLHFLNNFMSTLLQYSQLYTTEERSNQVVLITFAIIAVCGLAALLVLFAVNDDTVKRRLRPRVEHPYAGGFRAKAFFSVPVIVSIVLSLLLTVFTTQMGGAAQ